MLRQWSPIPSIAPGGGRLRPNKMLTVWSTPTGLDATLIQGINVYDVVAFVVGIVIEAVIESSKNMAIAIVAILFFDNFMFFYSPFYL
jgi:hypothetical protein